MTIFSGFIAGSLQAPTNTRAPVIGGTGSVGSVLSCDTGLWTYNPSSYAYQWKRDGSNIGSATTNTYTLVSADDDTMTTCQVIATNSVGDSAPSVSTGLGPIISTAPVNTVAPAVTGTATEGNTLSCDPGTWTQHPASYSYQWKRAGSTITDATLSTYLLVSADVGNTIKCVVTATNFLGPTPQDSNTTSSISASGGGAPANSGGANLPTFSGTATHGKLLTKTSDGTWTNSPTSYTYQWNRSGSPILGATEAYYYIWGDDVGSAITLTVTAHNASGQAAATTSASGTVVEATPNKTGMGTGYISGMSRPDANSAIVNADYRWLTGSTISSSAPLVLTFSFPSAASNYTASTAPASYGSGEPLSGFRALNSDQQTAMRLCLKEWERVANILFVEITESDSVHADLRYAYSSVPDTAWGYYPNTSAEGGDCWFDRDTGYYDHPTRGNYAWMTYIHETGHAIGLKHPQDWGPVGNMASPPDCLEVAIMSYRGYETQPTSGQGSGLKCEAWGFPQTPMKFDIGALQYSYGIKDIINKGNTTYSVNATTGELLINGAGQGAPGGGIGGSANRVFLTIWDGGGTDTLDLSAGSPTYDLTQSNSTTTGSISATGQRAAIGDGHTARANIYNAVDTTSAIEGHA